MAATDPAADTWTAAAQLAARRARIEEALILLLLRSPRVGLGRARAVGVTVADFDEDDLAAIFAAIEWAEGRSRLELLQGCRFLLRHIGRFDDTLASGTRSGATWSTDRLARAAVGTAEPDAIVKLARGLKVCATAFAKEVAT